MFEVQPWIVMLLVLGVGVANAKPLTHAFASMVTGVAKPAQVAGYFDVCKLNVRSLFRKMPSQVISNSQLTRFTGWNTSNCIHVSVTTQSTFSVISVMNHRAGAVMGGKRDTVISPLWTASSTYGHFFQFRFLPPIQTLYLRIPVSGRGHFWKCHWIFFIVYGSLASGHSTFSLQ